MGAFTKRWLIDKRRGRKLKINLLRRRYASARTEAERAAIIKKAQVVSPQITAEQFLGTSQKEATKS
jgi:hypothetical protein